MAPPADVIPDGALFPDAVRSGFFPDEERSPAELLHVQCVAQSACAEPLRVPRVVQSACVECSRDVPLCVPGLVFPFLRCFPDEV